MLPFCTFLTVCGGLLERRMLTTALLLLSALLAHVSSIMLCNNYILLERWPGFFRLVTRLGTRLSLVSWPDPTQHFWSRITRDHVCHYPLTILLTREGSRLVPRPCQNGNEASRLFVNLKFQKLRAYIRLLGY